MPDVQPDMQPDVQPDIQPPLAPSLAPPLAPTRHYVRSVHGEDTVDPWYWLRNGDDPAVEAYLHAENAYTEYATAHLAGLRAELFSQMRERVVETHDSLAVPKGSWEYFTRTIEGLAYPIYLRRQRGGAEVAGAELAGAELASTELASEITLLDANEVARGYEYFAIGDFAVSPNQELLAYTADLTGNEMYELFVIEIADGAGAAQAGSARAGSAQTGTEQTGNEQTGSIAENLSYGLAWANDNRTLFTVGVDEAQRSCRVQRHVIDGAAIGGTAAGGTTETSGATADGTTETNTAVEGSAVEVFNEADERFWVGISKTRSERFVVIATESETTSECHLIDADRPARPPVLVRQRRAGVEYRVDHQAERLLIVTNDVADTNEATDTSEAAGDSNEAAGANGTESSTRAENFCLVQATLPSDLQTSSTATSEADNSTDTGTGSTGDGSTGTGSTDIGSTGDGSTGTFGEWQVLIEHRPDTRLEGVDCFQSFAVVQERTNATTRLRLLPTNPQAATSQTSPTTGITQTSPAADEPAPSVLMEPSVLMDLPLPDDTPNHETNTFANTPTTNTVNATVSNTTTSTPASNTTTTNTAPFEISPSANLEYETESYRYEFTSLTTPPSVFEINLPLATDKQTTAEQTPGKQTPCKQTTAEQTTSTTSPKLLYQSPVAQGVDLSAYRSVRVWATSSSTASSAQNPDQTPDQTKVPISIVWRPDAVTWPAPCLLYGYGAYEITVPAAFSSARISLLDRGAVFAIAHVRGGGELGRDWYQQGRLQHKQNTFDDFAACARYLIAEGWTEPDRLVARGGSAGGLLMGAIFNQAPELFAAVIAEVPFVDVLNTMLDPSIPLTVTEFDEWGDPSQADSYEVIQRYAPYENINLMPSHQPALLVTAGLHDPRVQYWEPAKWVAKLRAANPATAERKQRNRILLRTQMSAGHGGSSGRYESWRDEAFVQAFALDALGLASTAALTPPNWHHRIGTTELAPPNWHHLTNTV